MDIRELNETLIKSMESACDNAIEEALADGEIFEDEDDIRNCITDDFDFVINRMKDDWEHYNGCEINRDIVEMAFEETRFIDNFEDILSTYCGRIIDIFFDDWVAKAFKAMKGEI